jgi:hypothetical protein
VVLKADPASTYIRCGSQAYVLEEAHGICAVAWWCFCLLLSSLFLLLSLLCDCRPVVDRRLVTFFASPKKVTQKRRRKVAALRVPNCASQKMGNEANSPAAQTSFISNPFFASHNWQRPMRIRFKSRVKTQQA